MECRPFVIVGAVQPLFYQLNSKADIITLLKENVESFGYVVFIKKFAVSNVCKTDRFSSCFITICINVLNEISVWIRKHLNEIHLLWIGSSTRNSLYLNQNEQSQQRSVHKPSKRHYFWWINIWSKFMRNSYFDRSKTKINILQKLVGIWSATKTKEAFNRKTHIQIYACNAHGLIDMYIYISTINSRFKIIFEKIWWLRFTNGLQLTHGKGTHKCLPQPHFLIRCTLLKLFRFFTLFLTVKQIKKNQFAVKQE